MWHLLGSLGQLLVVFLPYGHDVVQAQNTVHLGEIKHLVKNTRRRSIFVQGFQVSAGRMGGDAKPSACVGGNLGRADG